jgi:hypothetical protein
MKSKLLKFLVQNRKKCFAISFAVFLATITLHMTACGIAAWLSAATTIVGTVSATFVSLAAFIAGLTGNATLASALAAVSKWITDVQTGLTDLNELVAQYKASPSATLLATIESSLADVQANIKQDFSNLGLPASVLNVIASVAGEAAALLLSWDEAIQGIKSSTTTAEAHVAMQKLDTLSESLPDDVAAYKERVNSILASTTGDADTDAALANTPKL